MSDKGVLIKSFEVGASIVAAVLFVPILLCLIMTFLLGALVYLPFHIVTQVALRTK